MGRQKSSRVLIDVSHNNLLHLDDEDFHPFRDVLTSMGLTVRETLSDELIPQELDKYDLLVLASPTSALSYEEIQAVLDFVRSGGSLLLIHSYGGDELQDEANLNDLALNFEFSFINCVVKSPINAGVETIPITSNISSSKITKGVRKLVFGGSCGLDVGRNTKVLVETPERAYYEQFNKKVGRWLAVEELDHLVPLAVITTYGLGKVAAVASLDFFGSSEQFGLTSLDNKAFVENLFEWLCAANSDKEVQSWMLGQIGKLNTQMEIVIDKIQEVLATSEGLTSRLDDLEGAIQGEALIKPSVQEKESEPFQFDR